MALALGILMGHGNRAGEVAVPAERKDGTGEGINYSVGTGTKALLRSDCLVRDSKYLLVPKV